MAMRKCAVYLSYFVIAAFTQLCIGNFPEEPKEIPLELIEAYERKTVQEKIQDGAFALPEHQHRIKHIPTTDELDCGLRYLAYNYSRKLLLPSANLKSVVDGLQLPSLCGISPKLPKREPYREHEKKIIAIKRKEPHVEFFVAPVKGNNVLEDDNRLGTISSPFRKVATALKACEFRRENSGIHCIIRLREGIHFVEDTLKLSPKHSNIFLTAYKNENAVLSGGIEVYTSWKLYSAKTEVFTNGVNNLFEGIKPKESTKSITFMGIFNESSLCQRLCEGMTNCTSYTFFGKESGDFTNMCYGREDGRWNPIETKGAISGRKIRIYESNLAGRGLKPFRQIFVGGKREVRARYPNGNPENSGLHTIPTGYIQSAVKWLPPRKTEPAVEVHINNPHRERTPFATFYIGIGGPVSQFDPPVSYWGTKSPAGGAASSYAVPSGLQFSKDLEFASRKWKNASTGIVHALQHFHWENWSFKVDSRDENDNTLKWSHGGFQGARGAQDGREWYVENIFEELDVPGEWFLNEQTMKLYYYPSGKLPEKIIVPQVESVLSIAGTQEMPVKGAKLMGLSFAHTESTFMKGYAVPSGGDWSIHQNAMVFAQGTEDLIISGCNFMSPGGNGIFISNYTRNATISDNYISFAGDNGIGVVGQADFINGTNGNQPRGTKILRNIIHDTGLWGKGTYSYSQSVACLSHLDGNVFFNGPRGAININDGFGGGNIIERNVLFNFVRETMDHGPINTWDRVPYLTKVLDPNRLIFLPKEGFVRKNLVIGNYYSAWPIDHDDGSSYWVDSFNVLAYGGYKNYLGHSKKALQNVYVYPDKYFSDHFCMDTRAQALGTGASGWNEAYVSNRCIMNSDYVYRLGTCHEDHLEDLIPYTDDNQFYTKSGSVKFQCDGFTWTLKEFQNHGFDVTSTVSKQVGVAEVIDWGKAALDL